MLPQDFSNEPGVVDARRRFESKFPPGSAVVHPTHGVGQVVEADGLSRTVEFQGRKKTATLPAPPAEADQPSRGHDGCSISYVEVNLDVCHVTELQPHSEASHG